MYENTVSIHRYNMGGLTQRNRLPRLEIVFNRQLILDTDHRMVRIHVPLSALHRLHDLHLLHMCPRIHGHLDLRALRSLDYTSQIPIFRSQSQPRHQNVSGPFLRGCLPEH